MYSGIVHTLVLITRGKIIESQGSPRSRMYTFVENVAVLGVSPVKSSCFRSYDMHFRDLFTSVRDRVLDHTGECVENFQMFTILELQLLICILHL